MFLPAEKAEMKKFGWSSLDIIFITGDTYIDSSYIGVSILANLLVKYGYKVGVIAQPDIRGDDITKLGEPNLFWAVTAGSIDSMVANYTASKKFRKKDDFTPGGENNKRPDRASIVYSNLIRKYYKNTKPIVLGGLEAILRRIPHYDYWDDKIRGSLLFDAKADIIIYGMAEKSILQLADFLKKGSDYKDIRGICYIVKDIEKYKNENFILLDSYEELKKDKLKFIDFFNSIYNNLDPFHAKGLIVPHADRFLIVNPPQFPLNETEMDEVYDLEYEHDVHPHYKKFGKVKALETIKFSITSHRGCYGECNFCSISLHQGKIISQRSIDSIYREAKKITALPDFKGYILDVGGPTANMYGIECDKKLSKGICKNKRCLFPEKCSKLEIDHSKQIKLLRKLRTIKEIKAVFIGSGLRYDMLLEDKKNGSEYLREIVKHHISGQLKIAPEHINCNILNLMGKPHNKKLLEFRTKYKECADKEKKELYLTYYFIAAHPGSDIKEMRELQFFIKKELKLRPEQIQIFTPLPSTYSALMYYTEINPFTLEKISVEKNISNKEKQKKIVVS
jgi:uncharacterized radical SAM protein YgiQ